MKTYTIIKTRKGKQNEQSGTLEELIKYFGYTLLCGNSWNSKISIRPKSIKALVNNLNKSVSETQGSCYEPDYYELKEI